MSRVETIDFEAMSCPTPRNNSAQILLGHGSGGTMTADLVENVFLPAWSNSTVEALEDQAILDLLPTSPMATNGHRGPRVAFTTDSFVVRPLFFPGGDIGKLAICGTVNDLVVGGATPRFISAAFILEEGLPLDDLRRIVRSMREACQEANVQLVTGDTKVVDRGKGDGVFITTTGIGLVPLHRNLSIHNARPGDHVLVSGTIGDHGIAILSVREGLEFETELQSDAAPLGALVESLLASGANVRAMRDPTRGGLSSTLNEIAAASRVGIRLTESAMPIRPEVRGACELLGLDPMYVANEGKLIAIVAGEDAELALAALRECPLGRNSADIGVITAEHSGMVTLKSVVGGERVVSKLAGEQLPRIC